VSKRKKKKDWGEVAQTMYTYVSKNDKKETRKKKRLLNRPVHQNL
jgi:hypothetical protein